MVRSILGVIAGLALGVVLIAGIQAVSAAVYPMPEGMDPQDPEAMKEFVAGLPLGAFLFVLASYAVGSFGGGWIAALIARRPHLRPSLLLGVVLTVFGILNVVMIPHPAWFVVASLATFIPCTWLGGRVAGTRRKDK